MRNRSMYGMFFFVAVITTHCLQGSDKQFDEQLPSQEGFLFRDQARESNERLNQFETQFTQQLDQAEQQLKELKQDLSQAANIDRNRPRLQQSNVQTNQVEKELNDSLLDLELRAQELSKETQQLERKAAPLDRLECRMGWQEATTFLYDRRATCCSL